MGLANMIGKAGASSSAKRAGVLALGIGAAVSGMASGLKSQNTSDSFYGTVTGNPNIDQEVFGTDVNPLSFLSVPLLQTQMKAMQGADIIGNSFARFAGGVSSGFVNSRSMGDYISENYNGLDSVDYPAPRATRAPSVDGSLVFGQYNSRHA